MKCQNKGVVRTNLNSRITKENYYREKIIITKVDNSLYREPERKVSPML
jgi:hypothetical protein